MRILLLTKENKNPYNIRLHYDFLMKLKGLVDIIPIVAVDSKGTVIKIAKELWDAYHPDIMMMHFHSKKLLAGYLKNIPCKKVMIAVDSYKDGTEEFYKSNEFDLILQRHAYDRKRFKDFPVVWLPFSADQDEFTPFPGSERLPKVGFVGQYKSPVYGWRRRALQHLSKANLLEIPEDLLLGSDYSKFLRSVIAGITSTELNSPYGKMFEMMGSGAVVLTPPFIGEKELFGADHCYINYNVSCEDLVKKATDIINNPDMAKEIAGNAYKVFIAKHTDSCRLHELFKHLVNLMEGKKIEKRWGL